MTRAFLSLLRLDIKSAFFYHPLFPMVILVAVLWLLERLKIKTFSEKFKKWGLALVIILFFGTYFIRLYTTPEVVCIHPEEGLLIQIYNYVLSRF
ncbi:MAG: DUF2752 domain-containing protein [Agathobacter sp.]|nr:DUF2752 domain-containing protein [Agathobacter sp.]